MTDKYQRIRDALALGPTPGPWGFTELPRDMQRDGYKFAISRRGIGWRFAQIAHEMKSIANATYIAACDPDTIRALLAERDALQAECEKLRCIISDLKDWDCDVRGGFLSIPVDLRRRMQEAVDRARRIEGERE